MINTINNYTSDDDNSGYVGDACSNEINNITKNCANL